MLKLEKVKVICSKSTERFIRVEVIKLLLGGQKMREEIYLEDNEREWLQKELGERYEKALVLLVYHRQGPAFLDDADFEVLEGKIDFIIFGEFDDGYPYRRGHKVAIIPLTDHVIINYWSRDDTSGSFVSDSVIYEWNGKEWISKHNP